MIRPLKINHSVESEYCEVNDVKRKSMQPKITSFMKKETMEEIVGKIAAVDGFSINDVTKSEFITK